VCEGAVFVREELCDVKTYSTRTNHSYALSHSHSARQHVAIAYYLRVIRPRKHPFEATGYYTW
jgi:hypothetical protein